MSPRHILAAAGLCAVIALPAFGQATNSFETQEQLQQRRQAEQYRYEQEQRRRGNELNTEKPRPLGEPAPPSFGNPRPSRSDDRNLDPAPTGQPR